MFYMVVDLQNSIWFCGAETHLFILMHVYILAYNVAYKQQSYRSFDTKRVWDFRANTLQTCVFPVCDFYIQIYLIDMSMALLLMLSLSLS